MERTIRSDAHNTLIRELRAARKRKGLTQAKLASLLDEPQSFVAKIENGERRVDVVEALRILQAIGVSWKRVLERVAEQL